MRLRQLTLVVLAAATPLIAASCGGDDSADSNVTAAPSATTVGSADSAPTDSAPAAEATEAAIVIENFEFTVTEAKAGTITIRNDDGAAHTVTADDGSFQVTVKGGETATIEVDAGSYAFHCDFHPSMKATLLVV